MKIFIICSKKLYHKVPPIQSELESLGHEITLPNCYDDPSTEDRYKQLGHKEHAEWKAGMLQHSADVINDIDAVFVLNFEKNGVPNYIGGATFLEMYDAFRLGKKIFLYNDIPDSILKDEIEGFLPLVTHGDMSLIK